MFPKATGFPGKTEEHSDGCFFQWSGQRWENIGEVEHLGWKKGIFVSRLCTQKPAKAVIVGGGCRTLVVPAPGKDVGVFSFLRGRLNGNLNGKRGMVVGRGTQKGSV